MRNRFIACLLALLMVLVLIPGAQAEDGNLPSQIVDEGGTVYYDADGHIVENANDLGGDAVVKVSKTIEQYSDANGPVENEFVVTLQVQTTQDLMELTGDTPDSAILLVVDVSNSMDDCVICGKEENTSDHQGTSTTTYRCQTGGKTYTPRGNNNNSRCSHCNQYRSQHKVETTITGGVCAYQSRLEATQIAALDFLDEFANNTGAVKDDKRYVAIVSYGSSAVTQLNWTNVSTTQGMTAAQNAISNLKIANGGDAYGGGTATEAGLVLARNLVKRANLPKNSKDTPVEYCYTLLLTDGQPTYRVANVNDNSTKSVSGTTSNGGQNDGSTTQKEEVDDVAKIAADIRETSKLYSICFGQGVGNSTPFGNWSNAPGEIPTWSTNGKTIMQWLASFSNQAYEAEDATSADMFDQFEAIIQQIQIAAQAWKVEDWMGPHMIYVGSADGQSGNSIVPHNSLNAEDYPEPEDKDVPYYGVPAFRWNLLTSEPDTALTDAEDGVYGYSYKYRVKLDNLDLDYYKGAEGSETDGPVPANTKAQLTYAVYSQAANATEGTWTVVDPVEFAVPEVEGWVGSLTFKKVDQDGNPLKDWVFRLRVKDQPADGSTPHFNYIDATSDNEGVVTFANIPSGHNYILLEAEKNNPDYVDIGNLDVNISWGDATIKKNNVELDEDDGVYKVVNEYADHALGSLTLQKRFVGNEQAARIKLKITGENGYSGEFELNANDWKEDLGCWSWTLEGLEYDTYTIQEYNAVDANGNLLRETHDLQYKVFVDDTPRSENYVKFDGTNEPSATVTLKYDNDSEEAGHHTIRFDNWMTKKQGTLKVSKQFVFDDDEEHTVNNIVMTVTATPVDENGKEIAGATTYNQEITGTNSATFELPIGRYKLTEEITSGDISNYSFLHYAFATGNDADTIIEDGIVEIDAGTNNVVTLFLRNHYQQDKGDIHVSKVFDAQHLVPDNFVGHTIRVNVYKCDEDGNMTGNDPVDTIILTGDDNRWVGSSDPLPVGYYWLEEDTESAQFPDHNLEKVVWAAQGETSEAVSNTNGIMVHVTKNAHVLTTVTNTYEHLTGNLEIRKVIAGNVLPADYLPNITFTVKADSDDANFETRTVKLSEFGKYSDVNGTYYAHEFVELPVGTYTVTENNEAADAEELLQYFTRATTYQVGNRAAVTGDEATVTIENENTDHVIVTFTNTYAGKDSSLTIEKRFVGLDPGSLTEAQKQAITFTVTGVSFPNGETLNYSEFTDGKYIFSSIKPGEYTVVENNAAVDGYKVVTDYAVGEEAVNTVTISEKAPGTVTVTNTYTQKKGSITVTKNFAGLNPERFESGAITINIKQGNNVVGCLLLPDEDAEPWTATSQELPVGVYTLEEVGADVGGYSLIKSWKVNGVEDTRVVITDSPTPVEVELTNTYNYIPQYASLTVTKTFEGLPQDIVDGMTVNISVQQNGVEVRNIALNKDAWTKSIILAPGVYTLEETVSDVDGYILVDRVWTGVGAENSVAVWSGATASVSLANKYVEELEASVWIPVSKNVIATGDILPAEATFFFGTEWTAPNGDVSVRYVDAGSNLGGSLTQTAMNSYTVKVNGEGTVNGYIVITGYASALDGMVLSTWEKLAPYANEAEAKAAHWSYDPTALSDDLRWTVTLRATGTESVDYSIALGAAGDQNAITFANQYEEFYTPIIPPTGDNEMPLLHAALIMLSLCSMFLLRRKLAR